MGKTADREKKRMTELERAEYDHIETAHVIAQRLEDLVERTQPFRELMNAEEAADFIRMSYSEFRKIAPELPRYPISERRFVYRRSDLLEWVLSGQGEK